MAGSRVPSLVHRFSDSPIFAVAAASTVTRAISIAPGVDWDDGFLLFYSQPSPVVTSNAKRLIWRSWFTTDANDAIAHASKWQNLSFVDFYNTAWITSNHRPQGFSFANDGLLSETFYATTGSNIRFNSIAINNAASQIEMTVENTHATALRVVVSHVRGIVRRYDRS